MVSLRHRFFVMVALAAVLYGGPAFSQATDGSVTGTVRDATGAALPGATVTLTNTATNATHTATTANDGTYSASVPAGTYTVTVSLRGFGTQTRKEVKVTAGSAASADFSMEAGRQEEVTVTAMLREQAVGDVPFSIAAPTEDSLEKQGVDNIEGVAATVAGFSVQNLGPGQSQVAMRGVSAGQIVRDQPGVKEQVGAYLDDSIISLSLFTPDIDLFDVGRVEVLRGPQGTLFGAGSLSGTVRYISNQPQMGARHWFGEFGGSAIDGGSAGGNLKLGGNVPLGDTAALRAVGYYNHTGGYIDAVQPDFSLKDNVNSGNRFGGRVAVTVAPNDRFSITPRIIYQKVETDGWNRIDAYNILANPFTTSRRPVTLGEREQFTQIDEPFTDEFVLADLGFHYNFGKVSLASVTSYTHRDILVVRDAGALTASITGGSVGLPENVYTLDAPLDDATTAKVFTQELRLSGSTSKVQWVAGGFFSHTKRDYGQNLLVAGFEELTGIPTAGQFAPRNVLFFSDLHYKLDQFALFGEATLALSDDFDLTGGLRYYHFSEDKDQVFDGLFGSDEHGNPQIQPGSTSANGVAPRFILSYKATDNVRLNAQASRGFRLGGVNDPLNVNLCTPQDRVTFGGHDNWEDETAWNYEVGAKTRVMNGRGAFNVSLFDIEVSDLQATVTAGSCSSRVIFNVPKARSRGLEVEFSGAPTDHFDFSLSGSFNNSELRSSLTSVDAGGNVSIVSGIEEGNRLPTVPEVQVAAVATYQWDLSGSTRAYVTGSYQHIGSRFTQVGDQADNFITIGNQVFPFGTVNLLSFAPNTIGGPLTATTFRFDPELPAYDIVNFRVGALKGKWDVALYVNNLTDERALLALDQERGTRARVGFLTNQPRTFGFTARFSF